jgi:hypothetical protein
MSDNENEVAAQAPEAQQDANTETALTTTSTDVAAPTEKRKVKVIRKVKRRPARPQVDPSAITSEPPPQTGTTFNIWYNKWAGGDREDKYLSQTAAKGRCNIAKDTGYTKADKVVGSFFCLFFARGLWYVFLNATAVWTLANSAQPQGPRLRLPAPTARDPRHVQPQR